MAHLSDQFVHFLGTALVFLIVLVVFALARKYLPVGSVETPARQDSWEDLNIRFRGVRWIVNIVVILVGFIFAWSTHAALVWLNQYFSGPAEFRLPTQQAIWWFFPVLGALALSWEITLQLWSHLAGNENADLFSHWSSRKVGFNSRKMLRWLAVIVALPLGIFTLLALSMHTSLRADDIRDCGYAFAPCNVYRYTDARRMTMIQGFRDRNGKLIKRAGIVIDFGDGRRWSSAGVGDFNKSVDPRLADFLQKKTQLKFNFAQAEADIPLLNTSLLKRTIDPAQHGDPSFGTTALA